MALLLPRSADQVVSVLAVLKAGAAFVPVDPSYPADRTGYVLADCGARLLLTHRERARQLREAAASRTSPASPSSSSTRRTPPRPPRHPPPACPRCPKSRSPPGRTSSTPPARPAAPRA
ncbi:AMP-binding protein [Streptomyces albus]|nr:AMP-binding protein [Streptomyces albus]